MKKQSIQRRVKQIAADGQLGLLLPGDSPTPSEDKTPAGAVTFVDPDPRHIQIGSLDLYTHLLNCGHRDVFVIRQLLAEQDWSAFEATYKPGGRHPYAPRALLGLILYGTMNGRSSLRELEYLAGIDLGCWWLTGGIMPDHSVIGRFIQTHAALLTASFFESLTRSVLKATQSGTARTAGDGTVIEAAASRYQLLKREALEKRIEKTEQALAEATTDEETVSAQDKLDQLVAAEEVLSEREAQRKAKGKDAAKTQVNPMELEAVLQPLKRQGYGTSYKPSVLANDKRIILSQAVEPSSETGVVEDLLTEAGRLGQLEESAWDAGYHCEAILGLADPLKINLLIPAGRTTSADWVKQSDKFYLKSQFTYDAASNTYRCPADQVLRKVGSYKGNKTRKPYTEYGTPACQACTQRQCCTKSPKGRKVKRYLADEAKEAMCEKLKDEMVRERYRQRAGWVEPVFSQLKGKQGLNRFRRKGLAAVRVEFALHALAYNLGRAIAVNRGLIGAILWLIACIRHFETLKVDFHSFASPICRKNPLSVATYIIATLRGLLQHPHKGGREYPKYFGDRYRAKTSRSRRYTSDCKPNAPTIV